MMHLRSIYPDPECFDKQINKKIFGEHLPGKHNKTPVCIIHQVWIKLRAGKRHGSDATFKSEGLGLITTAFKQLQLKISLFKNWWNCIPREISLQTASTLFP